MGTTVTMIPVVGVTSLFTYIHTYIHTYMHTYILLLFAYNFLVLSRVRFLETKIYLTIWLSAKLLHQQKNERFLGATFDLSLRLGRYLRVRDAGRSIVLRHQFEDKNIFSQKMIFFLAENFTFSASSFCSSLQFR